MRWGLLIIFLFFSSVAYGAQTQMTLQFRTPIEVCSLVSLPGDFILQNMGSKTAREFYQDNLGPTFSRGDKEWKGAGTVGAIAHGTLELLSLNDPFRMKYYHAEVITDIFRGRDLVSWSFFPIGFRGDIDIMYKQNDRRDEHFRKSFSVFRARALSQNSLLEMRERALYKVKHREELYKQRGVCSDFVNWAYDDSFTSWWNFIPVIRKGIAALYPPEAISTPDDLADSPYTKKICEVREEDELVFPKFACTKAIAKQIYAARDSENEKIASHAQMLERYLIKKEIISEDYQILIPKLNFVEPISEEEVLEAKKACRLCKFRARKPKGGRSPLNKMCRESCRKAYVHLCSESF